MNATLVAKTPHMVVMPFMETQPLGITQDVTRHLVARLHMHGAVISTDRHLGDAVLTGDIQVHSSPSTTLRTIQTYRIKATVNARLTGPHDETLWQHQVNVDEMFLPTDPDNNVQPLVTEMRRRTALSRVSQQVAEELFDAYVAWSTWEVTS